MSRFSGPQHPGAQATARSERHAEAEARNLRTDPTRRRQYRLNPPEDADPLVIVALGTPAKRKRNRKS